MNFILEFLIDMCFEMIQSNQISRPIRWVIFLLVAALYLILIVALLYLMMKISNLWISVFVFVIVILIMIQLVRLFLKLYKSKLKS